MNDMAKKLLLAGLGLAALTEEKAKEVFNTLLKKGEESKKRDFKIINDLLENIDENSKEFELFLDRVYYNFIEKAKLATKDDIKKLEVKIAELERKLDNHSNESSSTD